MVLGALAFARFSPATGTFELGNAGLPDPFLISGDEVSSLEVPGPRLPLGARARTSYQSATWTLGPCDRLLMFTDGLPEAFDESGSPLGYERLEELLPRQSLTARAWLDRLFEALPTPSDGGLEDDWTAMVLERRSQS